MSSPPPPSSFLVDDPGKTRILRSADRIEVILGGTRRIYVEGALLQEARLAYRVAVVSGEPARENPTGLRVIGFSIKLEDREKASTRSKESR